MSFSSELLIKVLAVLALAPGMALGLTILDVKGASWMQRRPGPLHVGCLLYTSPSPRDLSTSRMPSSA